MIVSVIGLAFNKVLRSVRFASFTKNERITKDGKNTFQLVKVQDTSQSLFENSSKPTRSQSSTFIDQSQQRAQILSDSVFDINVLLASSSDLEDEEALQKKKARRKMGLREIEASCGLVARSVSAEKPRNIFQSNLKKKTTNALRKETTYCSYNIEEADLMEGDSLNFVEENYVQEARTKMKTELLSYSKQSSERESSKNTSAINLILHPTIIPSSSSVPKHSVRIETNDSNYELELNSDKATSSGSSQSELIKEPNLIAATETHFIDVGSLTFGGIFGLGEKMAHRVIMARTVVQCLLLPRYWLFEDEQNPGHVWQRRRFYLEGSIPSREELFGDFLKTRRWDKFKRYYVQSTLNPSSVNSTQSEDIPIICRIVETKKDSS